MQRKIYREHRKTLSVTIHGQIMDKLKETAAKKQMTVSAVTDEMLYRGLVCLLYTSPSPRDRG